MLCLCFQRYWFSHLSNFLENSNFPSYGLGSFANLWLNSFFLINAEREYILSSSFMYEIITFGDFKIHCRWLLSSSQNTLDKSAFQFSIYSYLQHVVKLPSSILDGLGDEFNFSNLFLTSYSSSNILKLPFTSRYLLSLTFLPLNPVLPLQVFCWILRRWRKLVELEVVFHWLISE